VKAGQRGGKKKKGKKQHSTIPHRGGGGVENPRKEKGEFISEGQAILVKKKKPCFPFPGKEKKRKGQAMS